MQKRTGVVAAVCILGAILATNERVAQPVLAEQRRAVVVKGSVEGDAEYRLLDALNDRIQERFRNLVDRRFGYARVATVRNTPHTFDAESVGETSAVRDLESARLRVVMYLAGRRVLRSDDAANDALGLLSLIKGPVVVTPTVARLGATGSVASFPKPFDLLDDSRGALLAFTEVESTEFARDGWKFVARPVRASDGVCFSCHRESSATAPGNALRLGDPLGAVLYAYQPLR